MKAITLPNLLTLSRVPMMFAIVAMLYWTRDGRAVPGMATAAFALYVIGGITDWLDGYLARRRSEVSRFGVFMDAVSDKVFMLGLLVALVPLREEFRWALVPSLLILCREFFVTGMRLLAASGGVVVAAETAGKVKTVFQIIAVGGGLLFHLLDVDFGQHLAVGAEWLIPAVLAASRALLVVATLLTLWSGVRYFVKYRRLVFN